MEHQILSEMRKLIYIFPLFVLLLNSCEQDANVDVPETEPKLVISCFIMPQDSFIHAEISKSNPIFSSSSATGGPVTDATVTIYGNSTSVQLVYNSMSGMYEVPTSAFPVIAGNEYKIVVSAPGVPQAEATTVVPLHPPVGLQCSASDTIQNSSYGEYGESRFEYSFNDQGGEQNFYRFVAYNLSVDSMSGDTLVDRSCWDIFNDENADGTTITYHSYGGYQEYQSALVGYDIWLLNCNYDYYMFHQSIFNYSGDDPFSEPTQIYTNVTNGLGVFAAANASRIQIPR